MEDQKCSGSLYDALQLQRGLSDGIEANYRVLSEKFYPDHAGEDAYPNYKKVQTAYTVLSDPGKKELYDAHGSTGLFYYKLCIAFHLKQFNKIFFYVMAALQFLLPLLWLICYAVYAAERQRDANFNIWASSFIGLWVVFALIFAAFVFVFVYRVVYVAYKQGVSVWDAFTCSFELKILFLMFWLSPYILFIYLIPCCFIRRVSIASKIRPWLLIKKEFKRTYIVFWVFFLLSIGFLVGSAIANAVQFWNGTTSSVILGTSIARYAALIFYVCSVVLLEVANRRRTNGKEKIFMISVYIWLWVPVLLATITHQIYFTISGIPVGVRLLSVFFLWGVLVIYQMQYVIRGLLFFTLGIGSGSLTQDNIDASNSSKASKKKTDIEMGSIEPVKSTGKSFKDDKKTVAKKLQPTRDDSNISEIDATNNQKDQKKSNPLKGLFSKK